MPGKFKTKEIIVAVVIVLVFAVAFAVVLMAYNKEGEKQSASISDPGPDDPNHIKVFVKLVSVDPIKGDTTARLEFQPEGDLAPDNIKLTKNLKLNVNSATGKTEHTFEKGKRMNPVEVVLNLYDSQVMDYPFDHHSTNLEIYFEASSKEAQPKPSPSPSPTPAAAAPTEGGTTTQNQQTTTEQQKETTEAADEDELIPIAIDFFGSIPGLKIEATKDANSTDDYVDLDIKFSRSTTAKFFSFFVMATMWGVTLMVVFLTLSIVLRGRKIEIGMFSFLAALLFAFVAFRNTQPGSPPIGTFGDYISFFWAETIIALCLLTIIFTWLKRPTAK